MHLVALQFAESPLEEDLATFAGQPGGLQVPAWQLRPPPPPQADHAPRVDAQPPLLPQPVSTSAALAMTQLQLLGRVFAVSEEEQQAHILESVTAALAAEASAGMFHTCMHTMHFAMACSNCSLNGAKQRSLTV